MFLAIRFASTANSLADTFRPLGRMFGYITAPSSYFLLNTKG